MAHPPTLLDGPIEDEPSERSAEELRELAENDPTWRAADGLRYEALYVLGDGRAWGRRGPAPTAPIPELVDAKTDGAEERHDSQRILLTAPNDRRDQVTSTTGFPERTIGALNQSTSPGLTGCTGAKVGPRSILTASHCVMNDFGQITWSGQFHPGQTRTTHPNTSGAIAWAGLGLRDHRVARKDDYAVLTADDTLDSFNLSWMGIAWGSNTFWYDGKNARVLGYPHRPDLCADSPLLSGECGGWMYRDNRALPSGSYMANANLGYEVDATRGQSGSPVFTSMNGAWIILGVHSGYDSSIHASRNIGARFRQFMWDDVCSWIAGVPSIHGQHSLCN